MTAFALPAWRPLARRLHLWLGFALAGFYVLTALTGAALSFYREIDRLIVPLPPLPAVAHVDSWQPYVDLLRHHFPQRPGPWRLELPEPGDSVMVVRYPHPEEAPPGAHTRLLVDVALASPAVLNQRLWGETVMTVLYQLHYALCLGDTGRMIQGGVAVASVISLISGGLLWLTTLKGRWRNALPRLRSGGVRRPYDLHLLGAAYALPVLLVVCATGAYLTMPSWFTPALTRLADTTPPPPLPKGGPLRIGPDQALATAQAQFPDAVPRWLEVPATQGGLYRISLHQPHEPDPRFPKTAVWIDAETGLVVAIQDAERHRTGDSIMAWMRPLHSGIAFGLPGQIIVCLVGALSATVPVTGLWFWWRRQAARRVKPRER